MFEYKEVFCFNEVINIKELQELGKNKWELCGVVRKMGHDNYYIGYLYYFKRPLLEYEM